MAAPVCQYENESYFQITMMNRFCRAMTRGDLATHGFTGE
jgi:hypothetical protein